MTPWWVAVVAAAVGGFIGASSAIASQWLQARTARSERRYQERRDAYAALARATWDVSAAAATYLGSGGEAQQREAFVRALLELPRQTVMLELLGSPNVVAASDELGTYATNRLLQLARTEKPTMEDVEALSGELGSLIGALLHAARADLGGRALGDAD